MATLTEIGEFGFIDRIARGGLVRPEGVICGIGDDCAVLEGGDGKALLLTADMMVEDVHFRLNGADPRDIGYKLLAVSLSDIAAMGGEPREAVVSAAVPRDTDVGLLEAVYEGLQACARGFAVNVAGGDTARSPGPLVLDLSLLGRALREQVCLRSGARPGDLVYVSGTPGDAAAGFALREDPAADIDPADRERLIQRHARPMPRVALGRALAATGAVTAMIDVSDGIASDLRHICERSGVSAAVDRKALPISRALKAFGQALGKDPGDLALSGGEDYELLFTVAADKAEAVEALGRDADGPAVTRIGSVDAGPAEVFERTADGEATPLGLRGHDHFR